ncbi:20529_t:CDS:2, partial [Dentiscutata erythropus]
LLSNTLLSDEYEEIKNQVQKIYSKEKFISLLTDRWLTQHNESIINYITLTAHGPIFFKSVATETHSHTAKYIAKGIQEAILEFKENFVVSVITDNAANMHTAWNILRIQFPSILFYGCAAHLTNLIISDIFKNSKSTDNSNELQWVCNTLKVAINPVKTRWKTQLAVLEKLLELKSSIQLELNKIAKLEFYEDNWDNILILAKVLHPIVKCITKFESDSATLSLVYKEMIDIKDLKHNITSPIQDSV